MALLLASAENAQQKKLLQKHKAIADLRLAQNLKKLCYETWMSAPEKTVRIVSAVNQLNKICETKEVSAIAAWISGIGKITNGEMKAALNFLEKAEQTFQELAKPIEAAETEVSKLYALAVLGRYEEALECSLKARGIFLENGEYLSAGKIEHNIGNIYQRQDRYAEAEEILQLARKRFSPEKDKNKIIQIENSLANALSHQNKFRESEAIYRQALKLSEEAELEVTQAEIESNLGYLSLFQGRYDRALQLFESSRRRYVSMKMPHQTSIAEQEIADTYFELNLIPEAENLYRKIIPIFNQLEMKAEKARALVYFARTLINSEDYYEAHEVLKESKQIYAAEKNIVGKAIVMLAEAQLYFKEKDFEKAATFAHKAEKILNNAGAVGRSIQALLLRGNANRKSGKSKQARHLFEKALDPATSQNIPQAELICFTLLGLSAVAGQDFEKAENYFLKAIELTEKLRAPLTAEDFRTAFITDKLTPFYEISRIYLSRKTVEATEKAFQFTELSRSRALLDLLGGDFAKSSENDGENKDLSGKKDQLREELNRLHRQLNSPLKAINADLAEISKGIQQRESELSEIIRQIGARQSSNSPNIFQPIEVDKLQKLLGNETALIEFTSFDGKFSAFVVTDEAISAIEIPATEKDLSELLKQFRFQIDLMRNLSGKNEIDESIYRTRTILSRLYAVFIKPLEHLIGFRRLIIVPHQDLNYVPFHALFDGFGYLLETREILYAPSAGILEYCVKKPQVKLENALFFGVADEKNPQVREEILDLSELFTDSSCFLDEKATQKSLFENAKKADILHLACHGKFRADNPLFSSLQLGNGLLTVRDVYKLDLQNCGLVVLSACETGISKVAKGEELLGLIRGFLCAGAPCLILSLWQVEDESTYQLMKVFYGKLLEGSAPSAALRLAQIEIMEKYPHPFFWSPFFAVGRWT